MSLEEDIKQSKFGNEYHKLVINIIHTASWISLHHHQLMKAYGITLPQFNILRILRGQKGRPVSINTLIERMIDKSSNASRIVDRLEEKGLVLRKVCPEDRRQVEVTITENGLRLLESLDKPVQSLESQVHGISLGEAELVNQLLDKIKSKYKS